MKTPKTVVESFSQAVVRGANTACMYVFHKSSGELLINCRNISIMFPAFGSFSWKLREVCTQKRTSIQHVTIQISNYTRSPLRRSIGLSLKMI